jgi:hypothetical protein
MPEGQRRDQVDFVRLGRAFRCPAKPHATGSNLPSTPWSLSARCSETALLDGSSKRGHQVRVVTSLLHYPEWGCWTNSARRASKRHACAPGRWLRVSTVNTGADPSHDDVAKAFGCGRHWQQGPHPLSLLPGLPVPRSQPVRTADKAVRLANGIRLL